LSHLKIRCRLDIAWFPFDEQICSFSFGSWAYTSNVLNYSKLFDQSLLKDLGENQVWSILKYNAVRTETHYEHWIDNQNFSEIKYKILMRRKPLFVLQNYVIPAMILSTVTLLCFFIPYPSRIFLFYFIFIIYIY
jgi:hypothetical protein